MECNQAYSAAEVERMMKLQDVLLKAMAKKMRWWEAAEIIGVSDRTMRRWRERLEEHGYDGLTDRRKGKPSQRRVPVKTCEEVLGLYQERYFDLSASHFHEKLKEEHSIELSYTWVKQALQGAGLIQRRRRRGPHRRRRERRPLPGMLLHIDGSQHRWLNDDRWYDLIVILDDATSEIYYAQLVREESTRTVMAALRAVVEQKGVFCALYSDRASHFFVTPKAGEPVDKHRLTQVGRALKELSVQMIPAYSPQARGRSERSFGTWQGRLPQELRLAGITNREEANRFLNERYIAEFKGASSKLCKRRGRCIPGRLNGPERRVGLCGDATRAPTQGPGFRKRECNSPSGPGILARKRKISGFGAEPHPRKRCSSEFFLAAATSVRGAITQQNRETLQRGFPVLDRHSPLFGDVFQRQV